MYDKTFDVDVVEFEGQAIEGFRVEHLGVALNGMPIVQAKEEAGPLIAHHGDFVLRFASGQVLVLTAETWKKGEGKDPPKKVKVVKLKTDEDEPFTTEWVHGARVKLRPNWPVT